MSDLEEVMSGLDFSKVPFHGRVEEINLLHSIYESMYIPTASNKSKPLPLTIISGFSGTGKSCLAEKFVDDIVNSNNEMNNTSGRKKTRCCLSLCGKFDELHSEDPFSAIVEALNQFSLTLLARKEIASQSKMVEKIRNDLKKSLGDESINVLTTVAPDLANLIVGDTDHSHHCGTYFSDNDWNRLKHAFLTFIRTISSEEHPLVIFFDNLQWIDSASLELLTSLLTDTSLRYVMFIGAHRSTEVDKDHPLKKSLEKITQIRPVERVELLHMSLSEVQECVSSLLNLNVHEVIPLVETVYSKTRGDIFFTMQVLQEFERRKILYFSVITFQWEWNLKDITMEVQEATDNAIDIVISKIKSTPERVQKTLIVIAHTTRSQIDIDTLHTLMQKSNIHVNYNELIKILNFAVLEGLLANTVGSNTYKFTHDRIMRAAHSLVPPGEEKDKLREKIGLSLFNIWITEKKNEWMLFVAADCLNRTDFHFRDPVRMVIINLEVGERSLKISAFRSASEFLQIGFRAIKKVRNYWKNYYDISMRLYKASANVELILGRYEVGYELAKEVFHNIHDIKESFPIYKALGRARGRQDYHVEALNLYWEALGLVGEERREKSITGLIWSFIHVNRYFKRHSDDDILNLPIMKDKDKLQAMELYNLAADQAFFTKNIAQLISIILRRIRLTFKYGLSEFAAPAFISFAAIVGKRNFQSALRISRLGKKILEITQAKKLEAKTLFTSALLIDAWNEHYTETINTLARAQKAGMETGEIEFAFYSRLGSMQLGFMAGHSLDSLCTECTNIAEQSAIFNVESFATLNEQISLRIFYLSGCGVDSDTAIDWKELSQFGTQQPSNNNNSPDEIQSLLNGYMSRLILAVYFGEYSFVVKWIEHIKKTVENSNFEGSILSIYYSGLALSGLFRTTGCEKYLKMARKETKAMKKLINARGTVKSDHRYLIMEADVMVTEITKSTTVQVILAFENAISAAIETKHMHDAALCSELAAQYFADAKETKLAQKYFMQAEIHYKAWGAMGKVRHLQKKRNSYLSNKSDLLQQ